MSTITTNINDLGAPINNTPLVLNVQAGERVVEPPATDTSTANPQPDDGARGLYSLGSGGLDPADELLQNRFLCRHGSLLVVGNTGIGKSSMTMQMMMKWALNEPCFGITPAKALKSLLIQGENDENDLAEMRDGVARSLQLSEAQTRILHRNVLVKDEVEKVGEEFINEVVEPLILRHQPDLVWIDPLFQYLGGDGSAQETASHILRQCIGPMIKRHNCAVVIIHHTPKPVKGQKRNTNPLSSAYDGFGSVEFSNWPRAVLSLQSVANTPEQFRLVAGKRGTRLGWVMPDGTTRCYEKLLRHSRQAGTIFWEEEVAVERVDADADATVDTRNNQAAAVGGGCGDDVDATVLSCLPAGGDGVEKQEFIMLANRQTGIGVNRIRKVLNHLVEENRLVETPLERAGKRNGVLVKRPPPQQQQPAEATAQPPQPATPTSEP